MKRDLMETARSKRGVCEGCEETEGLTKVGKATWVPFFLCGPCLQDEIQGGSQIEINVE